MEDYFKDTPVHATFNGRKAKTVTHNNNNNLPSWMSLQTFISILTLIGMVTGFFANNAIQNERAERLKADFEVYKQQSTDSFTRIGQQIEDIKIDRAVEKGRRDAREGRKEN